MLDTGAKDAPDGTPTRRKFPETVFILGAGFTKAFLPDAPLLIDDFDTDELTRKFGPFERASQLLAGELSLNDGTRIDIERLMTRLDSGMPYDSIRGDESELRLLLSELRNAFVARLQKAKAGERREGELAALASYIIRNQIACITFNYDDVLDEALWKVHGNKVDPRSLYWHPDGGYGFFCGSPESCVEASNVYMDRSAMLLLKLHGSINWRPRRGSTHPFSVNSIVHYEEWRELEHVHLIESGGLTEQDVREMIQRHLERDPLIIPPVLVKADLVREPLLKLLWSLAYDVLAHASKVVFVGYRLPVTDLAASFLFRESMGAISTENVTVVGRESKRREEIVRAYQSVIPNLGEDRFRWDGALAWARELTSGDVAQESLPLA